MNGSERTADDDIRVVDATEREATLDRLDRLSYLLDNSIRIPGTERRIGIDPLVGLIPVVGDLPTTGISAYIVLEAIRLGVPRATVARMLFNLAVDATVGSIPVVGDAFDAVWKANARNVALLESRLDRPASGADRRFLAGVFVVLVVGLLALSAATLLALAWLARELGVAV